jgi:hypothetical protein
MSSWKTLAVLPATVVLALTLAGCTAQAEPPAAAPAPVGTASAEPTPTPAADARVFTMPEECADITPASRLTVFNEDAMVLLGGPGGVFGSDFLSDPTPEESLGGISCMWGYPDSDFSSVTVSVAPMLPATRSDVLESFASQGLNEEQIGTATLFYVQGDKTITPAVVNVVRAESWISVITKVGGPEAYADALEISDEVYAEVYQPE